MKKSTTIRISASTKKKLEMFKNFEKESYNDVIVRLLEISKEELELSKEEIDEIKKSLEDIKRGRVLPLREAEKRWGI
ncbi:MAG: hypothetical protein J7L14_01920 [Candidatus Diapherotrites archaeon]|nr:hypothetical protein [Candidatus Diapherotrites archaeon]